MDDFRWPAGIFGGEGIFFGQWRAGEGGAFDFALRPDGGESFGLEKWWGGKNFSKSCSSCGGGGLEPVSGGVGWDAL